MYITCLELPIFEGKNSKTPNRTKKSFILRKILLYKKNRTCKSFFLYIPLPPTPHSLKHSYPKEGYHPSTILFPSSDLQTGPHLLRLSTPGDCYPRCFWGMMVLATGTAGRAGLQKSQFNSKLDNWHTSETTPDRKDFIIFENNQVSLSETKQTKSKRRNKAPKHQKRKVFQVTTTDFFFLGGGPNSLISQLNAGIVQ